MAAKYGIYKCEICQNTVSIIEAGAGDLVCCGQEMTLLPEKNIKIEGKEKHVPVIEITENKVRVKVGTISHPMEQKHHIMLVQVLKNNKVIFGKRLQPGEPPVVEFCLENTEGLRARALCNLHGLWTN